MKPFLACCAVLALFVMAANAHDEHKKAVPQTAPQRDNTQPSQPESSPIEQPSQSRHQIEQAEIPFPFSGPIQDHAHNKIVHFPLAFAVAGSLFVFISAKRPQMLPAARLLWLLAVITAGAAYLTGKAQEEPFEDSQLHEVVELHENLGIASAITLAVGLLLSFTRWKVVTITWAVVVLLLISVTGYYGGLLAHS